MILFGTCNYNMGCSLSIIKHIFSNFASMITTETYYSIIQTHLVSIGSPCHKSFYFYQLNSANSILFHPLATSFRFLYKTPRRYWGNV